MSALGNPRVAGAVARLMQGLSVVGGGAIARRRSAVFPEYPGDTRTLTIPASVAEAPAVVYRPAATGSLPPVHVNFHGGGYVMPGMHLDDPLCRYLAAEAGVVVVNVDYVLAPQHPFPGAVRQAYEVVDWVARHGADQGWDGGRLTVGGQSAGGGLAAAVARQSLEQGGPSLALQVLHYPPLDLTIAARDKPAANARPALTPWMGEVFDNSYVADPAMRADRLVSPAGRADTADLTGIAPALVVTAEYDRLGPEGRRYAERLRAVGALVEHHDVPGADHGYDVTDTEAARRAYAVIARRVREATRPSTSFPG